MKLNKNGWGTTQMFLLSAGLFVALLVAVFFISRLYGSLEASVGNKHYADLEANLESAAKRYVIDNNINFDGEIKIYSDTLLENGYLNSLNDEKGNYCSGYVLVSKIDFINIYKSYISCNNYTTLN